MELFSNQSAIEFPAGLTEKYRPAQLSEFIGLDKAKKIASKLIASPFNSAWLFNGPSGTGKTSFALALAQLMPAELHHVPSQNCNLETIERLSRTCNYVPMQGKKCHLILVDEADQMTVAAQTALLSKLDSTSPLPNTIWIFTCNSIDRFEPRFLSRLKQIEFSSYGISSDTAGLLQSIWNTEAPAGADTPDFARIVKDAKNNVRAALQALETALLLA